MKQIRILIGLFILGLLLAACGSSNNDVSRLTYKVTGNAGEAAIVYTTETGGREETAVTPPWETSFNIDSSFGFSLRVVNSGETGSVTCEVWIDWRQVGAVTGQKFASCIGSFSSDRDSSSTSFFSNSGDFERETDVAETAVPPAEPPAATQADRPDAEPTPTPLPPSVKAASVSEVAALADIYGLNNVAWSPDGTQLATSELSAVQLWQFDPDAVDTPLPALQLLSAPTEKRVESLVWSLDGAIIVGGSVDGVWLWDSATGSMIGELPHEYGARSFTWSPDGRTLASSSNDGYVRLWDAANNWQLITTLTRIQDTIREVAWSPDGTLIASTEQNVVYLWDAVSGEKVRTLEGHTDLGYVSHTCEVSRWS